MGVRICLGCMREIDDSLSRCPNCGFSLHDPHPKDALPLKTVLNDRYVIGKPVKIDGEGISYIAYDANLNQPAMVREYLPIKMMRRLPDGDVEILPEYLPQYKALLSDFEELYSHIMSWKSMQHIRKVYDLFSANHTIYAVSVYEKGMTLNRFLERRGGRLSWNETQKLFDPLLAELEMVHISGYLHRGISPDSLLVTEDGLVLIAFSITSAKVAGSELDASISEGYAAPEQFSVSPHGEWTDVYGLSAVIYRVLTGVAPVPAQERYDHDRLIRPNAINPNIPAAVSNALMHGLSFHSDHRIRSIHDLRRELRGEGVSVFDADVVQDAVNESAHPYYKSTQFAKTVEQVEESEEIEDFGRKERPIWLRILLRSIPIILIICLLLYQLMIGFSFGKKDRDDREETESVLSSEITESIVEQEPESKPESVIEEELTIKVPTLVGLYYDDVRFENYPNLKFEVTYEYSETYEEGVIASQSVSGGKEVSPDSRIAITVSKGSPFVTIPSASTYTIDQYTNLLKNKYQIPYEIKEAYSDSISLDYIISVTPAPGMQFDLENDDSIVIVKSLGPDPNVVIREEEPVVEPEPETESQVAVG